MNSITEKLKLYLRLRTRRIGWRLMQVPQPEKWVFITGCYNSGTTLLHKILGAHSMIGSMPNEGQFFTDQLPRGIHIGLPRLWALKPDYFRLDENSSNSINVEKLKKEWAFFYNHPKRPLLIEKTITNSARTRWLQHSFHNTHVIALFRNGYAVAEGIRRKEGHSWEKAVEQWKVSNQILLDDLEHISNHRIIFYEELTADPVAVLKSLTGFLNIPDLPESAFAGEFTIHKVSGAISNQNEKSFSNLSPDDIRYFNAEAGDIMKHLGYSLLNPD